MNGLIIDGKVYAAVKDLPCKDCDLDILCQNVYVRADFSLCGLLGATKSNDFGYRYSQELTDKINSK